MLVGRPTLAIRVLEKEDGEIFRNYFFTSSTSPKALPNSINASTKSMIAMPGNIARYASLRII